MDNFEKVEKLRERANVSYEEAKQALENSQWDILEAMIYLEKTGKINENASARFTTQSQQVNYEYFNEKQNKCNFGDTVKNAGIWLSDCVNKANTNSFCVERYSKEICRVPISVLIILLIIAFWTVIPLLIIGLFFNMRYRFVGPDIHSVDIDLNKAMDEAANAADNIKSEINNAVSKEEK